MHNQPLEENCQHCVATRVSHLWPSSSAIGQPARNAVRPLRRCATYVLVHALTVVSWHWMCCMAGHECSVNKWGRILPAAKYFVCVFSHQSPLSATWILTETVGAVRECLLTICALLPIAAVRGDRRRTAPKCGPSSGQQATQSISHSFRPSANQHSFNYYRTRIE